MTPLRQRMINDMTVRGLASTTIDSYLRSVTRLARHYGRSPDRISACEFQDYLLFIHQEHGLSWQTCNTVRHGVRFFFRITLGRPDPHFYVPGAKVPSTLPQILNHEELVRLFTVTTNRKHRAVLMTAYAAGLRASELGRLKVADIDSVRMSLRVDQGKGNKDRYVPLSPRLLEQLREYWRRDRPQHWLFPTAPFDRPMSRQTPTRIYHDAKCAITRACYHDPQVQRAYAECAEGYGFKIEPCPPRDPKKKGRVESGVKYVKGSFVPLREFRDLPDANAQLRAWLLGPAGNRVHGTTHEQPLTRFVETEREFLRPLPSRPPELAVWARVKLHPDCHVQFEKTYYSAPFRMVRQHLWLRATETTVQLFRDHELVATHPRRFRPGSRSTIDEHLPPEAIAYKLRDPQWCLRQSEDVGAACHTLVERLFAHRVLDNLRAAQSVIGLARRFGTVRLEAACRRALTFDDPKYRTVKTILENGIDLEPSDEPAFDRLTDTYTGRGRFCRDTTKLLTH